MTDKIKIDKTKPYTLLKGDALELLPLFEPNTFDAVICDPPYASGSTTTKGRMMTTARKYTNAKVNNPLPNFAGDQQDQLSWTVWTIMWMNKVKEVLKDGGVFAFFIDWRQLPAMSIAIQIAGLTWRGTAVWDKRNSRPQKGRFRQQTEYVMWGSKGKLDIKRNVPVLPGLYSYSNVQGAKRLHQTQKPLQLMRDIVKFCEPNGLILDPFVGSGSTLHAAILEGHNAVGIEKTDSYYEIAKERLENAKNVAPTVGSST